MLGSVWKHKKLLITILAVSVLFCVFWICRASTVIQLPQNQPIKLLFGERISTPPPAQASVFGKPLPVRVSDNIDYSTPGVYQLTYTADLFSIPVRIRRLEVKIIDLDPPVLTLEGDPVLYVKKGTPYQLPAYSVTDNADPAPAVTVQDPTDLNTEGEYQAVFTATDRSGNSSEKTVTIIVGSITSAQLAAADFRVSTYFPQTVLPEGEAVSDRQFASVYFVGDSNLWNMSQANYLNPARIMCRFALAPSNFDGEVIFNNREVYRSVYQLLEQGYAAPDVLILEIGLSDVAADHPKQFIQQYRDVVTQLQKIRPGMKIVVGSILPVTSGKHDQLPAQKQINLYNYQLAKMCQEMQLPFLETAEAFMDWGGNGYSEYYREDGYHLKSAYFWMFQDYVRKHLGTVMGE